MLILMTIRSRATDGQTANFHHRGTETQRHRDGTEMFRIGAMGPAWLVQLNQEIVACERCPRLRAYCAQVAREKRRAYRDQEYWGKPVPGFGDPEARVLIIGLAPGAHGSNRTGRVFTGDGSGYFM